MNLNTKIALPTLLLLSACGGGSGSDTTTPTQTTPVQSNNSSAVLIANNNIEQASSVALNSIFNNMALITSEGFTGVVVEESTKPLNFKDTEWIFEHLNKALSLNDNFTGVVSTEVDDCSVSGTISMKIDVQDANNISVNDSFTFTSNNCDDGDGITNGSFTFTFSQLTDFVSLDNYSVLGIDVIFNNFSYKANGSNDIAQFLGDYSLIIKQDLFTQEVDITTDLLTISIPEYQQTIENLIIGKVLTFNTNTEALSFSSTIVDELLGGSIKVATSEDFIFTSQYSSVPSSGVMTIHGANKSSITVTVLTSNSVQLDADLDGNDTIDNTSITSWDNLIF